MPLTAAPAYADEAPTSDAQASPVHTSGGASGKEHPLPHLKDFNTGWGPNFKSLQKQLAPDRDYITWIIEEPPVAMDLRSAELFRRSFVNKGFDSNAISHMMVAWQCHTSNGRRLQGAIGQTGEENLQTPKLFAAGWGMSAFWGVFTDGSLNTPEDVESILDSALEKGLRIAHVTFEVSRQDCQDMLSFLKNYLEHPSRPFENYGLNLDPRRFEGGGCGSFASVLLSKGHVLTSIHADLWRTLRGSLSLMGAGLVIPDKTRMRLPKTFDERFNYVWPGDLKTLPWDAEDGPALKLIDPELGLLTLRAIALEFSRETNRPISKLESTGFGLRIIDNGSRVPIDETYSPQALRVVSKTRKELEVLRNGGMSWVPVELGKNWGLLMRRN